MTRKRNTSENETGTSAPELDAIPDSGPLPDPSSIGVIESPEMEMDTPPLDDGSFPGPAIPDAPRKRGRKPGARRGPNKAEQERQERERAAKQRAEEMQAYLSQTLGQTFGAASRAAAGRFGEKWSLTDSEASDLGTAWGQVAALYMETVEDPRTVAVVAAVAVTAAIVGVRIAGDTAPAALPAPPHVS